MAKYLMVNLIPFIIIFFWCTSLDKSNADKSFVIDLQLKS